jgi:predicted DNA-binding WGR domain protein
VSVLAEGERYEFVGGNSRKFWEWRLFDERDLAVGAWRLRFRWGRLGTAGQTMDERFDSEALARWKINVKRTEKLNKGYKLALRQPVNAPPTRPKFAPFVLPPSAWAPKPARTRTRATVAKPKPKEPETPLLSTVRRVRLRD